MSSALKLSDQGYQIVGVADYDGDGKADLCWFHSPDQKVVLWLMNKASIKGNGFLINSTSDPINNSNWHAVQTYSNQTRGGS
jgi:hypothetical protein